VHRDNQGEKMPHVLVWDIETVPDLKGYAAANGNDGKTDDEIRAELGEKFHKHNRITAAPSRSRVRDWHTVCCGIDEKM
jgi:hypothetical protein